MPFALKVRRAMGATLHVRLMVAVVFCTLVGAAGCSESPTPAGILMAKIHGCDNVVTSDGSKQDDNTVNEGQCGLPADKYGNGPAIKVWVWARGDTAGQHRFIEQNTMADDCYISGSRPSPWLADLNFNPGLTGDIADNTVGICRRVATETHGHEIMQ
jgi:hypothetical protein